MRIAGLVYCLLGRYRLKHDNSVTPTHIFLSSGNRFLNTQLLSSDNNYNILNDNNINGALDNNESDNESDKTDQTNLRDSILNEISEVLQAYMSLPHKTPLETVSPTLLIEKSYLLTKSGFYEEIMEEYLNQCNTLEEVEHLEKVDTYLRRFISNERKSRSRMKLNYLMAGAASSRFEEAVQMLSEW